MPQRALLATRLSRVRTTEIAARAGQAFAFLFGFVGLFVNPLLILIAVFVWFGAQQGLVAARTKAALEGVAVLSATMTDLEVLAPDEPLSRAKDLLLARHQQDFPVVKGERVVGVLPRENVVDLLTTREAVAGAR